MGHLDDAISNQRAAEARQRAEAALPVEWSECLVREAVTNEQAEIIGDLVTRLPASAFQHECYPVTLGEETRLFVVPPIPPQAPMINRGGQRDRALKRLRDWKGRYERKRSILVRDGVAARAVRLNDGSRRSLWVLPNGECWDRVSYQEREALSSMRPETLAHLAADALRDLTQR